jgi:hypothetical protein
LNVFGLGLKVKKLYLGEKNCPGDVGKNVPRRKTVPKRKNLYPGEKCEPK